MRPPITEHFLRITLMHSDYPESFDSFVSVASSSCAQLAPIEDMARQPKFSAFEDILRVHDVCLEKISETDRELNRRLEEIEEECRLTNCCDKWDYVMASSTGLLAGLVDAFLVGDPTNSVLQNPSDNFVSGCVKKFAKLSGWTGPRAGTDEMTSAISFLEREFPVNYDQRHSADVGYLFSMSAQNHHLLSLAHSPSPIGLICSIINQWNSTSTFIVDGELITIDTESFELKGNNPFSKIFCGFVNWLGHIMSDVAGSSESRLRGAGVPIPFFELTQTLNLGSFGEDRKTLAEVARKVYENGYDLRFGLAQSLPVVMVELILRVYRIIRDRYEKQKSWTECLKYTIFGEQDLRMQKMLLVGQGVLCMVDLSDASIRSGGLTNPVLFFSRLNFIAWSRCAYLGLKVALRCLSNDAKIECYKLQVQAYRKQEAEVRQIVEEFSQTVAPMIQKFFRERHVKLEILCAKLQADAGSGRYLEANKGVVKIGEMYGFQQKMMPFKDFDDLIENDVY